MNSRMPLTLWTAVAVGLTGGLAPTVVRAEEPAPVTETVEGDGAATEGERASAEGSSPSPPGPSSSSDANAEGPQPADDKYAGQRRWGLGSVLGGGGFVGFSVLGGGSSSFVAEGIGAALLLPTFEAAVFRKNGSGHSIDISVPLGNVILSSVAVSGFVFQTDVFYNFNVGKKLARFIIGPGLGLNLGVYSGLFIVGPRIPAEIGVEFLFLRERLGLKLLARPFLNINMYAGGGGVDSVLSGGVLFGLGLSGYKVAR